LPYESKTFTTPDFVAPADIWDIPDKPMALITLDRIKEAHARLPMQPGDVDKVLMKRCVICSFPSRWCMGDGSKVRMVAFIDKNEINKDVPDRVYKYGTY
jgi:hypothetical protein